MMRLMFTSGTGPRAVREAVAELARACALAFPDLGYDLVSTVVRGAADAPRSVELWLDPVAGARGLSPVVGTHAFLRPQRERRARKRWFVGVSQLEALPESAHILDPSDVTIRATRAGGPGGQHVNTTATAVRAMHRPSGLSVRVASERSQARNRARALRLLADLLAEQAERARAVACGRDWRTHHRLERGRAVVEWRGPVDTAAILALCDGVPTRGARSRRRS